jgi:CheY-like chemotaxis protein
VRDTGAGISPTRLAHIFDRYYQKIEGDRRGSGLDLYFCRALQTERRYAAIPLIFMSAGAQQPSQDDCLYAAFVPKPMALDTLLMLIQHLIGRS